VFGLIGLAFLSANLVKFFVGGWFPLAVGAVIFILMTARATGGKLVRASMDRGALSQEMLIESLASGKVVKAPGTAIFMTSTAGRTPVALLHSPKHYRAIHQRVIFMILKTGDEPWVPPSRSVEAEKLGENFWRITGHSGFMQTPNVPRLLRQCSNHDLEVDPEKSTFFLGREIVSPNVRAGMARWREHLFSLASKLTQQPRRISRFLWAA
jgi:KUP system potassium uptake protein